MSSCNCIGPPGACPCIKLGQFSFTPYSPSPILPEFIRANVELANANTDLQARLAQAERLLDRALQADEVSGVWDEIAQFLLPANTSHGAL